MPIVRYRGKSSLKTYEMEMDGGRCFFNVINRSSHPGKFVKNLTKFKGKDVCQSLLFFNKVAGGRLQLY